MSMQWRILSTLIAFMSQLSSPPWLFPRQVSRQQPVSVWTTSAGSAFSGWASSRAGVPTTHGRASRRPPAGSRSICTGRSSYWTRFCTPCPSPTHSPWIEVSHGTRTRLSARMLFLSRLPWTLKKPRQLWLWRPQQQKTFSGPLTTYPPPPIQIKLNDNQTGRCIFSEFRTILGWIPYMWTSRLEWTCSARNRATEQHQLPGHRTTHLGQQAALRSNCQAESCRWFIRWLSCSPGSFNGGRQPLGEWNSLVLRIARVQFRSGVVDSNYMQHQHPEEHWNLLCQRHLRRFCVKV